jgi:hypothetical protein
MRYLRYFALVGIVGALFFAAGNPLFAAPASVAGISVAAVPGIHAQVVVAGPGLAIGWYGGRYWDGHRYWDHDGWYAAHPGWRGGWGPGWRYHPGVVVAGPGVAIGWYGGRYWDGHRYWDHDGWYAAHPGWRGGWGPGWRYRRFRR